MTESSAPFPGFSTAEMDRVWATANRVAAMLEFEAALALALADAGVAPNSEAEAVAAACRQPVEDPEGLLTATWEAGTPLIALVEVVTARLETDGERKWVHHGATSQDAIDTALMLTARGALLVLEDSLLRISRLLHALTVAHRSQPEMGRTFLQHARPTTFGRRAAGWLEPTLRHVQRIRQARSQLAVQLGGPVGTLTDYGPAAPQVVRALAERLDLQAPILPWHTDRSRIWGLVEAVEGPVRTSSKIAMDLALLAQSDIEELRVRSGGSSSMSGKRNPIDSIRALASAEACHGAAAMITGAKPHELDRGLGSWHVEWYALPILFQTASAVFEAVGDSLETLEIDGDAMAARVPADSEQSLQRATATQIDAVLDLFDEVVGGD
ncbi:MAG TPA: lyase family protein [Acidimicrobiia bacterium]|nr:lyase family protein [Acidimicrobiia bacterium]